MSIAAVETVESGREFPREFGEDTKRIGENLGFVGFVGLVGFD